MFYDEGKCASNLRNYLNTRELTLQRQICVPGKYDTYAGRIVSSPDHGNFDFQQISNTLSKNFKTISIPWKCPRGRKYNGIFLEVAMISMIWRGHEFSSDRGVLASLHFSSVMQIISNCTKHFKQVQISLMTFQFIHSKTRQMVLGHLQDVQIRRRSVCLVESHGGVCLCWT